MPIDVDPKGKSRRMVDCMPSSRCRQILAPEVVPVRTSTSIRSCMFLCTRGLVVVAADTDSKGKTRRMVDRVPSIGRGQILSAEDAPARIDAGIELDLGLGGSEKRRAWPEEPDPVHNKAGVHRSQPGDGSRAPGASSVYLVPRCLMQSTGPETAARVMCGLILISRIAHTHSEPCQLELACDSSMTALLHDIPVFPWK